MSDSPVFNAGQSLRRREMMKATVAGTVAFGMAATSSGTVAADDDGGYWPEPSARHALINPGVEALYNYVTTTHDDGYVQEDVDDMAAENAHLRIYQGVSSSKSAIEAATTQLENFISTDDPAASALAEMAFSTLRTEAFKAIEAGDSVSEARITAEEEAREELTTPEVNLVRQWNDYAVDLAQYFMAFTDEEDREVLPRDGGLSEMPYVPLNTRDDGLAPEQVFDVDNFGGIDPTGFEMEVREHTLPNGEMIEYYNIVFEWYNDASSSNFDQDYHPFHEERDILGVMSPDGDELGGVTSSTELGFLPLFDALDDIASEVTSAAEDYVGDIIDAYSSGDIEGMNLLSSYDLVRSYGDSDGMTRHTAEMLAAGLDAPADVTQQVTIGHPSVGTATGQLFLSWNWDVLADWEYTYESGTLELESASIDEEPDLELVFNDGTVTVTDDDLDDGVAQIDDDGLGDLEHIERHSEGELYSHIPVGTETDHWESAYFVDDDADLQLLDADEALTIDAVEDDGDELDKLELSGWNNQTRDPARALEEAERAEEQYVTVDELEETAHGGGGGGGTDTDALLIGGGIIALIGMIIAALSSGGS